VFFRVKHKQKDHKELIHKDHKRKRPETKLFELMKLLNYKTNDAIFYTDEVLATQGTMP